MAVINVKCLDSFKEKLKAFSKEKGETNSAVIRKAVNNYMAQNQRTVTITFKKMPEKIQDYGGRS
jgi:hypothetical protein